MSIGAAGIGIVTAGGDTDAVTAVGGEFKYGAQRAPYFFLGEDSLATRCRHSEGE